MKCLWTFALTLAGIASAQAFTCADVRALTAEQKAYYIRVYNITPAQRNLIRHVCSGEKTQRVIEAAEKAEGHAGHAGHEMQPGQ